MARDPLVPLLRLRRWEFMIAQRQLGEQLRHLREREQRLVVGTAALREEATGDVSRHAAWLAESLDRLNACQADRRTQEAAVQIARLEWTRMKSAVSAVERQQLVQGRAQARLDNGHAQRFLDDLSGHDPP